MSVDRYVSGFVEGLWACAESWSDGCAAVRVQGDSVSAETGRG